MNDEQLKIYLQFVLAHFTDLSFLTVFPPFSRPSRFCSWFAWFIFAHVGSEEIGLNCCCSVVYLFLSYEIIPRGQKDQRARKGNTILLNNRLYPQQYTTPFPAGHQNSQNSFRAAPQLRKLHSRRLYSVPFCWRGFGTRKRWTLVDRDQPVDYFGT